MAKALSILHLIDTRSQRHKVIMISAHLCDYVNWNCTYVNKPNKLSKKCFKKGNYNQTLQL